MPRARRNGRAGKETANMPNRILKESICLNRKIDRLTDFQENMFYRLIVNVDDYGVFLADPDVLASTLYPRKRSLSPLQVGKALKRMEELGLVTTYACEGEKYLKIVSWERHQRMRSSVHRYPMPGEADGEEEAAGEEAGPGEAGAAGSEGEEPAAEGIAAEGTEHDKGKQKKAEQEAGARELPVVELPLNDNSTYGITRSEIDEYAALYPLVHVEQELRNMAGWCMENRYGITDPALEWYEKAAEAGNEAAVEAIHRLAGLPASSSPAQEG